MNRFDESCNARFQDPFGRIHVPDKMEEVKLEVFNMKGINKRETHKTHLMRVSMWIMLCECRCGFDGRKHNSRQKLNADKCHCECKKTI